MNRLLIPLLASVMLLAACADGAIGPGKKVVVQRAGDDLLKLRTGPGLSYRVLLGLPDGTALTQHSCVTEAGQLWCRVSLPGAPRMAGYVSADYLAGR